MFSNESEKEYIYRICSMKDEIGTWYDVADILNANLEKDWNESTYRKKYQAFTELFNATKHQHLNNDYLEMLDEKEDRLYKQQVKTSDQLREKRKLLRDEARIEVLTEALKESIDPLPPLSYYVEHSNIYGNNEGILAIGDWHVGDKVDNFKNVFNLEVLRNRVSELRDYTISYCKKLGVNKLNVINLGDMISGNIHTSIRVSAELDMVSQIKCAAELIAQLLFDLSSTIEEVTYRSVLDNHSRMNLNYNEHIEKESFASLIDWYLQLRLENTNVNIIQDNIDENIGCFKLTNGKNVFFSHGHLEKPNSVLQDLTFGTDIISDYMIMGHYHSDKMKNFQSKKLFVNGSLKGTDGYALNHRLFSKPSQMLLVFDDENEIDVRINLH